jgi:protein-S-isoprenylcysteine O-methyltransferase Ste14
MTVNALGDAPITRRKRYYEVAARVRVPLGFLILTLYAALARPSWTRLAMGAAIAFAGLVLRAAAAGHLAKNQRLATSGPYAYTRNPLYLGSALAGLGFAVAGGSWPLAALLALYLIAIFLPVVTEEESHLAKLFPEFRAYAQIVPRFWPMPGRVFPSSERFRWALYWRNQEYNALLAYLFGIGLLVWKLR